MKKETYEEFMLSSSEITIAEVLKEAGYLQRLLVWALRGSQNIYLWDKVSCISMAITLGVSIIIPRQSFIMPQLGLRLRLA